MTDRNRNIYGFPCAGQYHEDEILRRQEFGNQWAANWAKDASNIPAVWKTPMQRKLDRAKVIAAEVCARRFPVKKIQKGFQE